jgi:hypothetical protein
VVAMSTFLHKQWCSPNPIQGLCWAQASPSEATGLGCSVEDCGEGKGAITQDESQEQDKSEDTFSFGK